MTLKAITQKEFEINLSTNFTFEDQPHIGLCISGGSDSMALLMLMRRWIKRLNEEYLHFILIIISEKKWFRSNHIRKKVKKIKG